MWEHYSPEDSQRKSQTALTRGVKMKEGRRNEDTVYMYVCVYAHTHTHIHIYVYTHVCMYK